MEQAAISFAAIEAPIINVIGQVAGKAIIDAINAPDTLEDSKPDPDLHAALLERLRRDQDGDALPR